MHSRSSKTSPAVVQLWMPTQPLLHGHPMFITTVRYTATLDDFLSSLPACSMSSGEYRHKRSPPWAWLERFYLVQDLSQSVHWSARQAWPKWATPLFLLVRALTAIQSTALSNTDPSSTCGPCPGVSSIPKGIAQQDVTSYSRFSDPQNNWTRERISVATGDPQEHPFPEGVTTSVINRENNI